MVTTSSRRKLGVVAAIATLGLSIAGCATPSVPIQDDVTGAMPGNLPEMIASAWTQADHMALAARYEKQASAAKEQVVSHQRMMERYEVAPYAEYYKGTHQNVAGFVEQCQALVRANEQAEADYNRLAELHRQMAAEATE
jgi:hypothetical protein